MNKFLASAILLLAFGEAEAHSHPGIDRVTHALEHMTAGDAASMPYLTGLALIMVLAWLFRSSRRQQ